MKISNSKQRDRLSIRLATPEDDEAIVCLQCDSLKVLATKDYTSRQLKALLKSKSKKRNWQEIIYVAYLDNKIVGFAAIDKYQNVINAVYVHPNFVRRGIGTMLLETIELKAIKNQAKILWVCSSLTGYPFYLANGYQNVCKHTVILGSAYIPCVYMKKRLLPGAKEKITDSIFHIFFGIVLLIILLSFVM